MIAGAVLAGLNHVLGQSAWARAKLDPFAGRRARLQMPPWQLDMAVASGGLFETTAADAAPDVEITLPADTPFLALRGLENVLQSAHVVGNAEFATELAYVLKNLRWDFEEDLSRLVGDIAAHRIAHGIAEAHPLRTVQRLAANVAEYAVEEDRLLVGSADFKSLANEIGKLGADIERAEKRVDALRR